MPLPTACLGLVPILTTIDFLLLPFFILIYTGVFWAFRNWRYKDPIVRRYFLPALWFRLAGAFLTALMYQYYYGYGDTFYYYQGVVDIFNAFFRSPITGLEMIVSNYDNYSGEAKDALTYHLLFRQNSAAAVIRTGGFF